jgi:hypothetical protein
MESEISLTFSEKLATSLYPEQHASDCHLRVQFKFRININLPSASRSSQKSLFQIFL